VNAASSPCRKKTTASPAARPFFVPPKLIASRPASTVNSRGSHPIAATALAKRAPSMWTR